MTKAYSFCVWRCAVRTSMNNGWWLNSSQFCAFAVRLGTKITETLKGKLSLGARILKVGGLKKVFRQLFTVREGERLLNACQCYLSTTAGPIAGLLFISTDKIAFCSERSIKLSSSEGKMVRIHYKVIKKITLTTEQEKIPQQNLKILQ